MNELPVEDKRIGLALLCDRDGIVLSVVRDDLGLGAEIVGRLFTLVVDRGSMSKALSFLIELREKGATFNWELNVPLHGEVHTLHVAGSRVEEKMLIVAAADGKEMLALYEEMMRIGNEQANALRSALKGQAEVAKASADRDGDLYDEISQLNSELGVMQRDLARKNVELERLNELKNQFLGMAAHDLRNPLHAITGYAEFLRDDRSARLSEEERQKFLDIILTSSRFMADLINDLLDVARIESGALQLDLAPVDVVALAKRSVQVNRMLASGKEITIALQTPFDTPQVLADAGKIEQVLNNLLTNAVKFSYPGSQVQVTVETGEDELVLRVADEGQGMTPEQMSRLFRPFARGRSQGTAGESSTGLGLVIVRKIVEGHHGTIDVQSEPGKGSTFTVQLPLHAAGSELDST